MEDVPHEVEADNIGNGKGRAANGQFLPGNGGRPVGAVNRGRKALRSLMDEQTENLARWFDGLESDRERLEFYVRLCPYNFPRMQSVMLEAEEEKATSRIAWGKLKPETIKDILSSYEGI